MSTEAIQKHKDVIKALSIFVEYAPTKKFKNEMLLEIMDAEHEIKLLTYGTRKCHYLHIFNEGEQVRDARNGEVFEYEHNRDYCVQDYLIKL